MAESVAKHLDTVWSPEFARYYVAHLGRAYVRNDLKMIGLGQKKWEEWYARKAADLFSQKPLICDTDWTVLQIWEEYRFRPGDDFEWAKGYGTPENADFYLLCAPDFPWQPDPLREHPEERDTLFIMYENLLREWRAHFIILSGEHDSRVQTALATIRELF